MKHIISLALCLCMLLCVLPARAEVITPETGVVVPLLSGAQVDLDQDGEPETVVYEALPDSYDEQPYVKLFVNDAELTVDGWYMDEQVYLLRVTPYDNPFLLVFDYGPSDDPETHFIYYEEGELKDAGCICANPASFRVEDGIITAQGVRGQVLYTWFHPADYVIANSFGTYDFETDTFDNPRPTYRVCPLPRDNYPMGLTVTVLVDLPLLAGRNSDQTVGTIPAGSFAMLSATDDLEWIYVVAGEYNELCGWVRLDPEYGQSCLVNGVYMDGAAVFDGLLFAD